MRLFSRRITERIAEHYGKHPAIIGWQLDNELNCETNEYYSKADDMAFRLWLKKRYGTLDKLNDAWGTVFWNQDYTDWEHVHIPRRTLANCTGNPHQHLDYIRFVSDLVCVFAKEQAEIIRKYCKPDDFITTNGIFGRLDYNRMMKESLDVLTYDSYPNFAYCLGTWQPEDPGLRDRNWSRHLAEVRALSPMFGIMEQQSGANGWTTRMEAPTPRPGQLTLWTMQSIAHGADYVSYFRWRTCTFGTEIYWHGILDYSSRENRRLREVRSVHQRLEKLQDMAGAAYVAKVGILRDYDNIWHSETDSWHGRLEAQSQKALFSALQKSHTPFDYVWLRDDLDAAKMLDELKQYDVLFYPHACILTEARIKLLTAYVEQGGKLVFGARTGYKDLHGHCVMDKLPGLAAELCGVDIPEYSFVPPDEAPSKFHWDGEEAEAAVFNDLLEPVGEGECLARYTKGYVAGSGALVRHKAGKGEAYYFGGAFAEDTVALFLKKLGALEPFADAVKLPEGCELAVREKNGRQWFFLLNYLAAPQTIELLQPMKDTEDGTVKQGTIELPPYGTKVLEFAVSMP